jgi:hypothetical protein
MLVQEQEIAMMNRISIIAIVVVLGFMAGCSGAATMINAKSQSGRTDVFRELPGEGSIPAGYADVVVKASIKTHIEGYYADESKDSAHGKEVYPFLINIDGQAVLWRVKGEMHQLPTFIEGKTSRDPEAGEGMKYVLEKKIRVAAGSHRVFFGLPEEPYCLAADISVTSGRSYVLEFQPKYWHKHLPTHIPTFLRGVNTYEMSLSEM